MQQRVITIALLTGLCFGFALFVSAMSKWRMPDNQQGYAPEQPIAYSHRLHAGELGIDCKFCHSTSESSRYAGIPSSDVCMKCHRYVTAPFDVIQQERDLADKEKRKPVAVVLTSRGCNRRCIYCFQLDKTEAMVIMVRVLPDPWVCQNTPSRPRFPSMSRSDARAVLTPST